MSECPRYQCGADDARTLHNGYIAHRSAGETPCKASKAGHAQYVRERRAERRAQEEQ